MSRRYTPEFTAKVAALFDAGLPRTQIAVRLEMPYHTVCGMLQRRSAPPTASASWSAVEHAKAIAMRRAGHPVWEIASALHRSLGAVKHRLVGIYPDEPATAPTLQERRGEAPERRKTEDAKHLKLVRAAGCFGAIKSQAKYRVAA